MKHRQIVLLANKIEREIGLKRKHNGYFDWQYIGDMLDDYITIEFCFDFVDYNMIKKLNAWIPFNKSLNPTLKGCNHDLSKLHYQVALMIEVK